MERFLTTAEQIAKLQAIIAQVKTYQKLYWRARDLHSAMRNLPQPGNYQLHDMFRTQADEFDAQATDMLRALRADGWCKYMTPQETIWDLENECQELAA